MALFGLAEIFTASVDDHVVARYRGEPKTRRHFLADVQAVYNHINRNEGVKDLRIWVLFFNEAYLFAVALFALSLSAKKILIPGNITEHTLGMLTQQADAFLGDVPHSQFDLLEVLAAPADSQAVDLPKLALNSELVVFTSGSSGEPKAIHKTLQQFNAEVIALEQCFGVSLSKATWHIATVSHQHIYGLIFRILWPLASGRPFVSEQVLDTGLLCRDVIDHGEPALWVASPAHLKRVHAGLPWAALAPYLKEVFSSGGPLSADAARQCHAFMGFTPIEVFGSSETGGIAQRRQQDNACWQPLPNVQIKTQSNSDGQSTLMVQSPHMPEQRWYQTDDAIELMPDGQFLLRGRLDRIVKLEEKRLSLTELEQALSGSLLIIESCALVVNPQRTLHRDVLAVVAVLTEKGRAQLESKGKLTLVNSLKAELRKYFELSLIPKKWRFINELPVNGQAKINMQAIQRLFN